MSLTLQFCAADPHELLAHLSPSADELTLFDQVQTHPVADFPGRLLFPDDLDSLCQALRKQHPQIPPRFEDLCVKRIWEDAFGAESLTLLSDQFASVLAGFSEHEIEQAARDWDATFPSRESLSQTPASHPLLQLREVARQAVTYKKSLLFYLLGAPAFFEYLRFL